MNKLLLMLLLFAAGCSSKPKTVYIEAPSLALRYIYRVDSVESFVIKMGLGQKKLAASYLQKGEDAEKENPEKAVYFYKRAITLCPEKETYLKLLPLFERTGNLQERGEVLYFLTNKRYKNDQEYYIFGPPGFDIEYERILNMILLYGEMSYYDYGEEYKAADFRKRLEKDERITLDRSGMVFKTIIFNMMDEEERTQFLESPEFLSLFFRSFADTVSEYLIDEGNVSAFHYPEQEYDMNVPLSGTFGHLLPQTTGNYHLYDLRFRLSGESPYKMLIYAVDSSARACPKEMRHITHYLGFFDENGKVVSSVPIAWQSGEELVLGEVHDGKISRRYYRRKWNKLYNKEEFDNFVAGSEEVKTDELIIDAENGRVQEAPVP